MHGKNPLKAGAPAAGLPAETVAYSLRHSAITDLISTQSVGGREVAGLDIFTVAALAGTSVRMIELHYGHLLQDRAQAALSMLAL